jgi:aminoglycoside phosphotransferase (APT) family kinase protein
VERPETSSRKRTAVVAGFAAWLRDSLSLRSTPTVVDHGQSTTGFSSDTFLLDLRWADGANEEHREVVLRLPPPVDSYPLFPSYRLDRQAAAMQLVGERSSAPVPEVLWVEEDPSALGTPFFVMDRRSGQVAPDMPPYTWGSWVTQLPHDTLHRMSEAAIDVLATVHSIEVTREVHQALTDFDHTAPALTSHLEALRSFYAWAAAGRSYPTVDRCFDQVEAAMPSLDGPNRVCWGDARMGNLLWDDAELTAVLDWEMVTIGPPELDVAWMLWFAEYFQGSAERQALPGAPGLLAATPSMARYEAVTGHRLRRMDWFLALTALHQVLIAIRTSTRAVAFGQMVAGDDHEALLHPLPDLVERLEALDEN